MRIAERDYVEHWVVCITGYMQGEGRRTGLQTLQYAISEKCHGPHTRILLKAWRDDMDALAERIWIYQHPERTPRITIAGYSYGGYTATLLCSELAERGLFVENLFLVDPVWRPKASWASPLSLLRDWTIFVPSNVRKVWYWHQIANSRLMPQGHKIKLESDSTLWINRDEPPRRESHLYIDDAQAIHKAVLAEARPHLNPVVEGMKTHG